MTLYAIGDIHGQMDMLVHALGLIKAEGGSDAEIVFVGDYTDRGPQSRAVIEYLIQEKEAGRPWVCLKGNHDRLFSRFIREVRIDDPAIKSGNTWLHNRLGGPMTLASYLNTTPIAFDAISDAFGGPRSNNAGLEDLVAAAQHDVPSEHIDILDSLPLTYETDTHLFVHAGIRPRVALENQTEDDLIWIREPFFAQTAPFEKIIIHGHTAYDQPTDFGNRIGIDGGAGYFRPLVPIVLDGVEAWKLTVHGRQPIAFPGQ